MSRTECPRCLMTSDIKGITFNAENGQCSMCNIHDRLEKLYPINESEFFEMVGAIHEDNWERGKHKSPFDCIMAVSGGADSSWLLYRAVSAGLKPLAFHFDNCWNSPIAEHNIKALTGSLGVPLVTYRISDKLFSLVNFCFLKASVCDADIPNDIAMAKLFYNTARHYKIKNILNAHDFRTEGSAPLSWTYMDGKYIKSVCKKYGRMDPEAEGFPILSIWDQIKMGFSKIKTWRPLYWLDYDKPRAKERLSKIFGWKDYGGHHCENIYTEFVGSYLLPKKFLIDKRIVEFSALIRSGKMTKEEAKLKLSKALSFDPLKLAEVRNRMGLTEKKMRELLDAYHHTFKDFDTYHKTFIKWKHFVKWGVKLGILPHTFYEKYTKDF